jgi:hypothetical protein
MEVLAAVVIRDGTVAACEWGIVADAGKVPLSAAPTTLRSPPSA